MKFKLPEKKCLLCGKRIQLGDYINHAKEKHNTSQEICFD